MKRISAILERITNVALVLLMLLLTISTAAQVVSRFIIKSPLLWTEEVSRMTFIWIALLGSTVATKHSQHLGLDVLVAEMPPAVQKIIKILVHGMMMAVALLFIVAGWEFVLKNSTRISETTGYPMYILYIAAPVAGVLMLFYLVEQIPRLYVKMKSKDSFPEKVV